MKGWALLGVPLYTIANYRGMGEAPSALREEGLSKAVGASADLGDVQFPDLPTDVVEGGLKNLSHFKQSTSIAYGATRSVDADRLVVLGGECSETVGVMAGLAEAFGGKPGMLWLDAHGDFNVPESSPSGFIGGMCLAMAAGRTPGLGLLPGAPPVTDGRLVHIGSRALDPPEAEAFRSSRSRLITSQQVRKRGAADVATEAAEHLEAASDWIACHLDLDVVDPGVIQAVNYPEPGGLGLEDTSAVIRAVMKTGKVRLVEVAAYNPTLDPRGASIVGIMRLLRGVFGQPATR